MRESSDVTLNLDKKVSRDHLYHLFMGKPRCLEVLHVWSVIFPTSDSHAFYALSFLPLDSELSHVKMQETSTVTGTPEKRCTTITTLVNDRLVFITLDE